MNGFGSEVFKLEKHLDENGCSREVDFASSVKFERIIDKTTPDMILNAVDEKTGKNLGMFRLITQHITPVQK